MGTGINSFIHPSSIQSTYLSCFLSSIFLSSIYLNTINLSSCHPSIFYPSIFLSVHYSILLFILLYFCHMYIDLSFFFSPAVHTFHPFLFLSWCLYVFHPFIFLSSLYLAVIHLSIFIHLSFFLFSFQQYLPFLTCLSSLLNLSLYLSFCLCHTVRKVLNIKYLLLYFDNYQTELNVDCISVDIPQFCFYT